MYHVTGFFFYETSFRQVGRHHIIKISNNLLDFLKKVRVRRSPNIEY